MANLVYSLKNRIQKSHQTPVHPLDVLLDTIVRLVVRSLIPIPLSEELIVQMKGPVIAILINVLFIGTALSITVFTLITQSVTDGRNTTSIQVPIDGSFVSTDIPLQNPLGGQGLSLVIITAGYMDPAYQFFGGIHTGVDFVPNSLYYQTNRMYKQTRDVVVYATLNGKVLYYVDQYGSHTVEIVNKENTMKSIDMHLNKIFVTTGQSIVAGTPIGTMGDTGFATGEHLHYELRVNNRGTWLPTSPLAYIQ